MKAYIKNKSIVVLDSSKVVCSLVYTDIINISYCLARFLSFETVSSLDLFLPILRQQKSMRACVQKFNAICKALNL